MIYHKPILKQACMKYALLFSLLFLSNTLLHSQIRYDFDLEQSVEHADLIHSKKWSDEFGKQVLNIKASGNKRELNLAIERNDVDWTRVKYMVCEIYHPNAHTLLLDICFFRKNEPIRKEKEGLIKPWLQCTIGVLPKLKTQVIFPFEYLTSQTIFLPRFPRQLKGVLTGSRIDLEEVEQFSLRFFPSLEPNFAPEIEIASVYLTDQIPENYKAPQKKYVDQFGQWTAREWEGKVHSEKQLEKNMRQTEKLVSLASFPSGWSQYGGLKAIRFEATGFFRVHHDGKRWWFVDPEGCAFLSTGINCITSSQSCVYNDMEDLLEWMPEKDGKFASIYSSQGPLKRIDYFQANQMRVYGDQWLEKWKVTTPKMMKKWRFNTVGNWSEKDFGKESNLPYVHHMNGFPSTEVYLFRDFPDIYSPEYRNSAAEYALQLLPLKDDKQLLGYFLCNEPKWAFGDHVVAYEMFATNQLSYSKLEFVRWLKNKYKDIYSFNIAWNLSLRSIDEILLKTFKKYPSESSIIDFREFTAIMVDEYVKVVCEEVKRVDPNHLNLGMRYAWISTDILVKPARYFDVLSMSAYTSPVPPPTEEISRISGRPILLSEWHFGCALDGGLPSSGLQTTLTQKERGKAYRMYAENGFSRPEIIGMHWFQWADQALLGRRDGENYNIGLLDICLLPYHDLVTAATVAHERMYDLAQGKTKPYMFTHSPTPIIGAQE